MDRNCNAEASDVQRGERLEAVKRGDLGPFLVTQAAEMFPCICFLAMGGAEE